jgi:hypothetical protein
VPADSNRIRNTPKEKCGFKLKGDGPLTYHLGCDYVREPNGTVLATPKKYFGKMLEWYQHKYKEKPKKCRTLIDPNDHPELDTSKEVELDQIKEVQLMAGQFQWLVSLGHFDIFSAVTTLSRYRTKHREGHILRCKGLFGYLPEMPEVGIHYRTDEPDFSALSSQVFEWSRSVTIMHKIRLQRMRLCQEGNM